LLAAVIGWIFTVKLLGKQFNQLASEQAEEKAPPTSPEKEDPVLTTS
jgi:hypothetical protein